MSKPIPEVPALLGMMLASDGALVPHAKSVGLSAHSDAVVLDPEQFGSTAAYADNSSGRWNELG